MKRILPAAVVAASVLSLLASGSYARAVAIRIVPVPERVALAQAVVVGKVTSIEEKTVSAESFPGAKDKVEYQIAVVKVADGLFGTKGLTHIKVGFIKPPAGDEVRPLRPIRGFGPPHLAVDQEGVFFLSRHHAESFYVMRDNNSFMPKADNDNYKKELEAAKECAKLIADPKAGLKSKKAEERALTAALLVVRYTTPLTGREKREDIDAEESKLILKGLADGDWSKGFSPTELTPMMVFGRLNLQPKDGWNAQGPFNTPNAYQDAAKAWLKDHADKYRIQRYVTEKNEKKEK
jgi:hypothetical protein